MSLAPGLRMELGPGTAYQVEGLAWESPRHAYWHARKVFWNYRHQDRTLVEAEPEEWLRVLIRLPSGPGPGAAGRDPDGERLRTELERIASVPAAGWFPEPLDVVPEPQARGPLLVLADPGGRRLDGNGEAMSRLLPRPSRFLDEVLTLLEAIHDAGLVAGGLEPEAFVIGRSGRWAYFGTDRLAPAPAGDDRLRADLHAWAELARSVLAATEPDTDTEAQERTALLPLVDRVLASPASAAPRSVAELRRGRSSWRRPWRALRDALRFGSG